MCCRRYPDWVSSDTLNRHILDGYSLLESGADPRTVADVWQRAWKVVPPLARTWRVLSVTAFDKRFRGVHEISTWANDYDLCLSDAARIDDANVPRRSDAPPRADDDPSFARQGESGRLRPATSAKQG